MKRLALLVIVVVLAIISINGCDNRSQIEKDADKAVKQLDSAIK